MKNISTLEKILRIKFKDKNILIKSLTHKSYSNNNNEKL
jgi:dsRNA-specific ribonuclease